MTDHDERSNRDPHQADDPAEASTASESGGVGSGKHASDSPSEATTRSTSEAGAEAHAVPIPKQIGDYTILSILGEGGMGVVYRAQQSQPRREVALKLIRPGVVTGSLLKRFQLEADILARLQHPGIAQVYQADLHEGAPYFAMELIEGESLTRHARANNLSIKQRLELFAKICDAVQHAHQKGVVHRDLKPGNILVDRSGQPKILDFGVARATDGDIQTTTIQTDIGQLIGTIPYMSPEQASGDPQSIDTRSDVYALGVILYELLAGRLPYDLSKKLVHEAVRIIQEEDPTRLSSIHKTLRGDVETIVGKALEKEKDRRYQSASALSADVRRYLSDVPIAARPPSATYQLRKFAKRNKAMVTGIAAVFVVLVAGVIASTTFAVGQAKARAEADTQRAAAEEAQSRATSEADNAKAINDFLTDDLLAAVAPSAQSGKGKDVLMRDVLDEASKKIDQESKEGGKFAGRPLIEASIRMALGITYQMLGEYEIAEPHLKRALEIRHREIGEEHTNTLVSLSNLAGLYTAQGRYSEAEALDVRTLEIQIRTLGQEHPDTLITRTNLATGYSKQGRYAEAEPLLIETLDLSRHILGEEHIRTIELTNNLAVLYWNTGRLNEAEPLLVLTTQLRKSALGAEHPDTLRALHNLAILYTALGRLDESKSSYSTILEIQNRVLGHDHPDTLRVMSSLGILYATQGQLEEAESLLKSVFETRKRVLGEEHPSTLVSMTNLANIYKELGRYDMAELLQIKSLDVFERTLGEQHPNTLMSMSSLASMYAEQGRYEDAEPLFLKAVKISKRILGVDHPFRIRSMEDLGAMYLEQGRLDEAHSLVRTLNAIRLNHANLPNASAKDKGECAWTLLTCEPADLRDPETALRLALQAVDMTDNADPGILDTLALAQHLTGDTPGAIETEKKAISLLPPGPSGLRTALEESLAKYEAAISSE